MDSKTPAADLPEDVQVVREWFDEWRQTRCGQGKISEELWALAVEIAVKYGVHPAAKMLRVDYKCLKRRVLEAEEAAGLARAADGPVAFVEIYRGGDASSANNPMEGVLELEWLLSSLGKEVA